MAGHWKKNDDVLALALASGHTIAAAAAKAGMGERTAYRRLDDPAFCRRIETLQAEIVKAALGRLTAAMAAAVDRLCALLNSKSDAVCARAARTILELGIKLRETADSDQKMKELAANHVELKKRHESKKP